MLAQAAYFDVVASEWPAVKRGNLACHLDYLFGDVDLAGARVLDIGAGDGLYSLWTAASGARQLVALEPEAEGSEARARDRLERAAGRLGSGNVEVRAEKLQDYESPPESFDVVMLIASINHLAEKACMELHRDSRAREMYRDLLHRIAELTVPGGSLIVTDASRHNLFARLPLTNPVARWIEWEKHQPPSLWAELFEEAGFERPRIRWHSFNTLRRPGRVLLGNRFAAWFLEGSFRLTMKRRAEPLQGGFRFPSGARESVASS
jgi:2-polyprenyl-3-methyl-5-hydroxy-6-metoxy-1,4-benzoquinol methylase